MPKLVAVAAIAALAALAAAATPAAAQSTPPQIAQAPAAGVVLASGDYSEDSNLRCDLLEARRVTGGVLLVRWRIVNTTSGQSGGVTSASPKKIRYSFNWSDLYYIDPAENKRYQFLTDASGNRILEMYEGDYAAGQQRTNWAKFPAPPASSTKISIVIPKFAPFEDVTIAP